MKTIFSEIEPSPGQPSPIQTEPFSGQLFLLTPPSLPARLWREIRLAFQTFRHNPSDFIKAILRGDGLTRQRLALLQSGAALAVAAYSLLFIIVSLLGLYWPTQAETLTHPSSDGHSWRLIPIPVHKTSREAAVHQPACAHTPEEPAATGENEAICVQGGRGGTIRTEAETPRYRRLQGMSKALRKAGAPSC